SSSYHQRVDAIPHGMLNDLDPRDIYDMERLKTVLQFEQKRCMYLLFSNFVRFPISETGCILILQDTNAKNQLTFLNQRHKSQHGEVIPLTRNGPLRATLLLNTNYSKFQELTQSFNL